MPSAPKTMTCRAKEIKSTLEAQILTKHSEETTPNFFKSTLEIAHLLELMGQHIDTLMEKQAALEGDLPTAPTKAKLVTVEKPSPQCTTYPSKVATDATTGIGGNSFGSQPGYSNNCHWDAAGLKLAQPSSTTIRGLDHVVIGRARMWICGQNDVIKQDFTRLSRHAIIVNCKNVRVPEIDQVCQQHAPAITALAPMNIGYAPHRWERFERALLRSIDALNLGGDVIIHCHSGVHRAALVFALNLMFLQADTSFEDACKQLKEIRPQVDLDRIINPEERVDGNITENMKLWIWQWEKWSRKKQYYCQIQKTQLEVNSALPINFCGA